MLDFEVQPPTSLTETVLNLSYSTDSETDLRHFNLPERTGLRASNLARTQLLNPNHFFDSQPTSDQRQSVLNGSDQDDHLSGEKNISERFFGKSGVDVIRAGKNDDYLRGGKDQDWLQGQKGHDDVVGNLGDDRLWGDAGSDRLRGDHGNDILLTGQGNDVAKGGIGNDVLDGDAGNDWLNGNQGNDVLRGGNGSDRLVGYQGDDVLDGGRGVDVLFGGQGNDTFVLSQSSRKTGLDNVDVILDFTPGEDTLVFMKRMRGDRLDIITGQGELRGDTIIRDAKTGNYLAILKNVRPEEIQPESFGILESSLRIRKKDLAIPSTSEATVPDEMPNSPTSTTQEPIISIEPSSSQPGLEKPIQSDPISSSSDPINPSDPDPTPTDPTPTDPTPTDPTPTDPTPTDPTPTDPTPTDPTPTDPTPTDPPPTDPTPTDPPPTDPPPTDPTPTDPTPTDPTPPVGSVVSSTIKFAPSDTETTIASKGAASITVGTQTFYIGTQQVTNINQNPIISSFDSSDPSRTWDRTDYEMTGADGRGYGLFWSGTDLYGIFSVDGTQGTSSQDFRRASGDAVQNWLKSYGKGGGPKIAVVGRINPQTGALLDAAYLSAVLTSNGNTNSLAVTGMSVNGEGNLVIQAQSWFAPRNPDGSAMTPVDTSGGSPFDYTIEITPDLSQVISTAAVGWT